MALMRSPLLPKGFYWTDLIGEDRIHGFEQWRAQNQGKVVVRETADFADEEPHRQWVKWEVVQPVLWLPASKFGFPTIAKVSTTLEDTVQRPDPNKDFGDRIVDAVNETSPSDVIGFAKTLAVVLGIVWIVSKFWRSGPA